MPEIPDKFKSRLERAFEEKWGITGGEGIAEAFWAAEWALAEAEKVARSIHTEGKFDFVEDAIADRLKRMREGL